MGSLRLNLSGLIPLLRVQPLSNMKTQLQKHQIIESVRDLDQSETEQVLNYIRGLRRAKKEETAESALKREAMLQIRHALRKERILQLSY